MVAAVSLINVPLVPLHSHTQTGTYTQSLLVYSRTWPLQTSGFMVCEQHAFSPFFMRGLDKQYVDPIDRYAVRYPLCWDTFLAKQNSGGDIHVQQNKGVYKLNMWKCSQMQHEDIRF